MERRLHFEIEGKKLEGTLFIGAPAWSGELQKWICPWSISYIHPETGTTAGVDPLDAFIKALDFLSILIRGSEDDGLIVWWKEVNDHAGLIFPLSENKKWEKIPPDYAGELPPGLESPKSNNQ